MAEVKEKRHEELGLSDEQVLEMFRTMLLARKIDERMWLLNRAGKIPFVISCQGQEAQVGRRSLLIEKDYALPYYRDMGVVLAFGMTAKELMLSAFAKAGDQTRWSSNAWSLRSKEKSYCYRFISSNNASTTCSWYCISWKNGEERFSNVRYIWRRFFKQGDFHEGANFAGVHKLPVIFMCENNKYAISIPVEKQLACKTYQIVRLVTVCLDIQ